MPPYIIRYHRLVIERDFRTVDTSVWNAIRSSVREKLSQHPEQFGKPLRNVLAGLRVLRAGDFRIVFCIEGNEVHIGAILHRREGYRSVGARFA